MPKQSQLKRNPALYALSILSTCRPILSCKMCTKCNKMAKNNRTLKCKHCLSVFATTMECSNRKRAEKARRSKTYKTRAQLKSENERLRKKVRAMALRLKLFT